MSGITRSVSQGRQAGLQFRRRFSKMKPVDRKKFSRWLASYTPLKGEIHGAEYPVSIRGKSFTELHLQRYRFTLEQTLTFSILNPGDRVLDIGPYPGGWISLLYFYHEGRIRVDALGIDFSKEFKSKFAAANIRLIEFDVDLENPICKNPGQPIPLGENEYSQVYLLETIEHLFNPLPILKKIKESLKEDGVLVITTDNPHWYGFFLQSILKRRSPWGMVAESHIFNQGDWRPHYRLYDIPDLTYLLQQTGLAIKTSMYFSDGSGTFTFTKGKWKRKKNPKVLLSGILEAFLPKRIRSNRSLILATRSGRLSETEASHQ